MLGFPLLFLGWLLLMFNIWLDDLYLKLCNCFGSGRTKRCVVLFFFFLVISVIKPVNPLFLLFSSKKKRVANASRAVLMQCIELTDLNRLENPVLGWYFQNSVHL